MDSISPIKLNLSERLEKDPDFRKRYFRGQAQDEVAASIVSLRRLRKKRQVDLAKETMMKQSAVSRIEQAEYSSWNLNTLFRVADALDARLRLVFDPLEKVISEYREKEHQQPEGLAFLGEESPLVLDFPYKPISQEASSKFTNPPVLSFTS